MLRGRLLAAAAALTVAVALLAGCGNASAPAAGGASTSSVSPPTAVRATVTTDKGVFVIALRPDKAPKTVANFVKLANAHFYDDLRVHRVVPGFVAQMGDPLTKGLSAKEVAAVVARAEAGAPASGDPAIGTGGPGWTIPFEQSGLIHDRGAVAMARTADPNSAGSQFYVTLAPAHQLDGQYAVFGSVVSGMDVVDKLAVGDLITSISISQQ